MEEYSVQEGLDSELTVCIMLTDGLLQTDVVVNISTADMTALAGKHLFISFLIDLPQVIKLKQ